MIMEGYERLIKEQEDLIRRLRMDLEKSQKESEEAARQPPEPQLFVDLNGGRKSDEATIMMTKMLKGQLYSRYLRRLR